jgi:hypothetical protein
MRRSNGLVGIKVSYWQLATGNRVLTTRNWVLISVPVQKQPIFLYLPHQNAAIVKKLSDSSRQP